MSGQKRRFVDLLSTFHCLPSRPQAGPHPPSGLFGDIWGQAEAMDNGKWTVDNEQPADRHSTVYFPLSTLSAEGRPPPPLRAIRFHLVTLKKRRRAGAGEQRSRPGWHFGIGIIAFLALLALGGSISRAPRRYEMRLGRAKFRLLRTKFELFGHFLSVFSTQLEGETAISG